MNVSHFDVHAKTLLVGDHQPSNEELQKVLEFGISLSQENRLLVDENERHKKLIQELNIDKEKITSRLEDEISSKLECIYQNKLLEKTVSNLESQIEKLKISLKVEKSRFENKKKEHLDNRHGLIIEISELHKRVKSFEENNLRLKNRKQYYKNRFVHFRETCESLNETIQKSQDSQFCKISKLEKENDTLNSENSKLKILNFEIEEIFKQSSSKLSDLQNAYFLITDENSKLTSKCNQMEDELNCTISELEETKKKEKDKNSSELLDSNVSKICDRFHKEITLLRKKLSEQNSNNKYTMFEHFEFLKMSVRSLFAKNKKYKEYIEILYSLDFSKLYEEALKNEIGIENWYNYIGMNIRNRLDRRIRFMNNKISEGSRNNMFQSSVDKEEN